MRSSLGLRRLEPEKALSVAGNVAASRQRREKQQPSLLHDDRSRSVLRILVDAPAEGKPSSLPPLSRSPPVDSGSSKAAHAACVAAYHVNRAPIDFPVATSTHRLSRGERYA